MRLNRANDLWQEIAVEHPLRRYLQLHTWGLAPPFTALWGWHPSNVTKPSYAQSFHMWNLNLYSLSHVCVCFLFGIIRQNIFYPLGQKTMFDPFVFTKKTVLMQRLSDLVRTGHHHYVSGSIPIEKAAGLATKLDSLYDVDQGKLAASRQRKKGSASFRLLMFLSDGETNVLWFLIRTEGEIPEAATREKWRNAIDDRIQLTGYELVRLPRVGSQNPAFTWRYTKEQHDDLRHGLLQAIRTKRDDQVRQLIHSLWRSPGFAGTRAQVKKFADLIKSEWKRSRGSDEMPEIPARLGYVRRLADKGARLSVLTNKGAKK